MAAINPTDALLDELAAAHETARRAYWADRDHTAEGPTVAEHHQAAARRAMAAALAVLERDYDVQAKLPPVEHRPNGKPWWNHYAGHYEAECVCGETFGAGRRDCAEDLLLDHVERDS